MACSPRDPGRRGRTLRQTLDARKADTVTSVASPSSTVTSTLRIFESRPACRFRIVIAKHGYDWNLDGRGKFAREHTGFVWKAVIVKSPHSRRTSAVWLICVNSA